MIVAPPFPLFLPNSFLSKIKFYGIKGGYGDVGRKGEKRPHGCMVAGHEEFMCMGIWNT